MYIATIRLAADSDIRLFSLPLSYDNVSCTFNELKMSLKLLLNITNNKRKGIVSFLYQFLFKLFFCYFCIAL
jgi:hypothetical protein